MMVTGGGLGRAHGPMGHDAQPHANSECTSNERSHPRKKMDQEQWQAHEPQRTGCAQQLRQGWRHSPWLEITSKQKKHRDEAAHATRKGEGGCRCVHMLRSGMRQSGGKEPGHAMRMSSTDRHPESRITQARPRSGNTSTRRCADTEPSGHRFMGVPLPENQHQEKGGAVAGRTASGAEIRLRGHPPAPLPHCTRLTNLCTTTLRRIVTAWPRPGGGGVAVREGQIQLQKIVGKSQEKLRCRNQTSQSLKGQVSSNMVHGYHNYCRRPST